MAVQKSTQQWALIGVGVILTVLAGLWVFLKDSSQGAPAATIPQEVAVSEAGGTATGAENRDTSTGSSVAKPTTLATGESISVADQLAGSSVMVSAKLSKPSWVAIKDATGRILGAAWFKGPVADGTVKLLRATTPGFIYYAVIYVDDGDKKFDPHADSLVVQGGSALNISFLAR